MNWVDLLVLGVAGISALIGFVRGLVREVLGIGAWLGAALIAAVAFPLASAKARTMITDPGIADGVAVAAVFLVSLILLSLIASFVGGVVRNSALGGLDRTLGLVFGLARGAALIVIAYIVLGLIEAPAAWPPEVLAARALPFAYDGAAWVVQMLPERYRPRLDPPPAPAAPGATALLQASPDGSALDPPKP
ncbi:MAG TPA: CvpA family protein [Acetobacteraceae bacterium]|nr:CvpA family protein [Acetobacteraceae bacterium]